MAGRLTTGASGRRTSYRTRCTQGFADWQTFMAVYGEVEVLPTNLFLSR